MRIGETTQLLDRDALIGDLAMVVRTKLAMIFPYTATALALATAALWLTHHPGAICFALTSAGTLIIFSVWRGIGAGLPIVPLIGLQNLLAYGLPVLVNNETVMNYPARFMNDAGIEILVFSCCLAGAWRFGMVAISASSALCYALQGFDESRSTRLVRLAFTLIAAATAYEFLQSIGVLDSLLALLPSGSMSIVNVGISGASACGFFLGAMLIGKGVIGSIGRVLFWAMMALNCYIAASSFLLSSTATLVFSVMIGLFWGSGRVPWKFALIVILALSYLNLGKFVMRAKYWGQEGQDVIPTVAFADMPSYYNEWVSASFDVLTGAEDLSQSASLTELGSAKKKNKEGQSLLDRVNNLQNLLYVIDAEERLHYEPLGGATYALIPPLLLPRIIWPEKPRTHEGQVLLNVHFGRQDLNSTIQTYVAWGLQAEAYGNYGPIVGSVLLGSALGLMFAWVEQKVAKKLLLSLEGFLAFTLFLGMANSFEMVASVLVTSVFQACIPIVLASLPFVERIVPKKLSGA